MDISSALAGRQLPQPGRVITRLHDVTLVDLPTADNPTPTCTRTAIIFAEDVQADPRIYDILLSFHYRAFKHRVNLLALAKVRNLTGPALRWWYGSPLDAVAAQRALSDATYRALWPAARWSVESPIIVKMRPDGTLDRDGLAANDLLRTAVPERYTIGLVHP
jgi:hypothetical protein